MSNHIFKLDECTANKIAAGEVVDRPASVIKELVENSIDAKSKNIIIEIKDGGKSYIRVSDDGSGIYQDDIEIAFERHATSKIQNIDDLSTISSLGFRGEALASIASVSKVEMITKHLSSTIGTQTKIHGGRIVEKKEVGSSTGTTMIVEDLFYNTPARLEFMKSVQSESTVISEMVSKLALSNPSISFQFINNGTIIFTTSCSKNALNNIVSIYGKELAQSLVQIHEVNPSFSLEGYVSKPSYTRGNRQLQIYFVNGRYVKSKVLYDAINEVYKTLIPSNKFPVCFLYVTINPNDLDVNIHPTKMEIRIKEEELLKREIVNKIKDTLFQINIIPDFFEKKNSLRSTNIFEKPLSKSESPENQSHIVPNEQLIFEDNSIYITDNKILSESNQKKIIDTKNQYQNIDYTDKTDNNDNLRVNFSNMNLIGQAFQTYIIGQDNNKLYLIDQHAAHERVIFEELLASYRQNSVVSQKLISPIVIELSYTQFENSRIVLNDFNRIGFETEIFGNNSFLLRSVPVLLGKPRAKELFLDIIDNLSLLSTKNEFVVEKIIMQACKSAIKAMDSLNSIEMKELLRKLSTLDNPYTCPHGRPTIICLTKSEIERRFKRT